MKHRTDTELEVEELKRIEGVLACLDQTASECSIPLRDTFTKWYETLLHYRDIRLKDWNNGASCGLRNCRMLYRCDNAELPYHMDEEGPCDIYTPDVEVPPIPGKVVHICDTCAEIAAEKAARV